MKLFDRLFGHDDEAPPHVKAAVDTVAEAETALKAASAAVKESRAAKKRSRLDGMVDDYAAADELRGSPR